MTTQHTKGEEWRRGDVTAKYKPFPETQKMKRTLEEHNLDKEFDCISIGNALHQIALIPTDNEKAEAYATLIIKAPKMEAAIKKALSVKALWMNPINNSAGERAILKVLLKQFEEAIL